MGDGVGWWGKQGELWECMHTQNMTFQTQLLEETMLKLGQEGLSRSHLAQPSPAERCRIFHQMPTPFLPLAPGVPPAPGWPPSALPLRSCRPQMAQRKIRDILAQVKQQHQKGQSGQTQARRK